MLLRHVGKEVNPEMERTREDNSEGAGARSRSKAWRGRGSRGYIEPRGRRAWAKCNILLRALVRLLKKLH